MSVKIGMPIPYTPLRRTYARGPAVVRVYYHVHNTTRVGVHICVYTQEKGVG
jgi:hypothetical protein